MRIFTGGVAHAARTIEEDLQDRDTRLNKPHVTALADLAACALSCRNVNTAEWQAVLPRKVGDAKSKERYISRVLANPLINPLDVMEGYIPEILQMQSSHGQTVILMLDQSKIADDFECLMISVRIGERAMPAAWITVQTFGAIGYEIQEDLLKKMLGMIPEDTKVLFLADRFYGTAAMVKFCQKVGWQYRIRLKSNLILEHAGGELTTGDVVRLGGVESARFHKTSVRTNIAVLHEKGHKEPWIIALDGKPSDYRAYDYGMRWGIECLFSDFKSRGFAITKTHLQHADRIDRLILVLTIALVWAISTGMQPKSRKSRSSKKNKIVHDSPGSKMA